jgi:hypothetical protein
MKIDGETINITSHKFMERIERQTKSKYWHFQLKSVKDKERLTSIIKKYGNFDVQFDETVLKQADLTILENNNVIGRVLFLHVDKRDICEKSKYYIHLHFKDFTNQTLYNSIKNEIVDFFNDTLNIPTPNKHTSLKHNKLIKKPKIICTIDDVDYYKGLEIICKKYLKTTKKMKLYVNYSYIIKSVNSDCAVIHEPVENVDIRIGSDILQKHFRLAYANTCHSVQGLTIEDEFTIFDCENTK